LSAVASLCMSAYNERPGHAQRMVAVLVDGLRVTSGRLSGSRAATRRGGKAPR
jgi:hypothetical protein